MVWMESLGCMVYLCSPKLRSLQELEERGLHISDIAQHDTTRDLILLNQQRLAEMELSNQLERKKAHTSLLLCPFLISLFSHPLCLSFCNFIGGAEDPLTSPRGGEEEDGDSALRHVASPRSQPAEGGQEGGSRYDGNVCLIPYLPGPPDRASISAAFHFVLLFK